VLHRKRKKKKKQTKPLSNGFLLCSMPGGDLFDRIVDKKLTEKEAKLVFYQLLLGVRVPPPRFFSFLKYTTLNYTNDYPSSFAYL